MKNDSPPQRILGVDYGLARLGLALSDERRIIAMPHRVLRASSTVAGTIKALLAEIASLPSPLAEIVIGLPLMMSGKTGMLADEVQHFAAELRRVVDVPVTLWDERLTTVQAERSLREGSLSRKKRTARVDSVAAVLILQSYLDYTHNTSQKEDLYPN